MLEKEQKLQILAHDSYCLIDQKEEVMLLNDQDLLYNSLKPIMSRQCAK